MINITTRTSKFSDLQPYDYFAAEDDFIEVCEWINGEGVDVCINKSNSEQRFTLTYGEFEALQSLMLFKE